MSNAFNRDFHLFQYEVTEFVEIKTLSISYPIFFENSPQIIQTQFLIAQKQNSFHDKTKYVLVRFYEVRSLKN